MREQLLLAGGFLGTGKTTLLLQAANRLAAGGCRVGIVTNDQGQDLVDTALVGRAAIPVVEVAGGCFCCRFPDLVSAVERLQESVAPDVILAEPVGSCTDLTATVLRPFLHDFPGRLRLAPLTILVDAQRDPSTFPAAVKYLYRKQLAEAECIVLNKSDRLTTAEAEKRLAVLEATYPEATVMALSARSGAGVGKWLDWVLARTSRAARQLELDYTVYAAAEAALGWLNAKGFVRTEKPFSVRTWMTHLLHGLDHGLSQADAAIAHVKLHVTTPATTFKASLTQSGGPISWDTSGELQTDRAQFILNARVGTDVRTLEQVARDQLAAAAPDPSYRCDFTHFECFRPRPPRPTHRLSADGALATP